MNCDPQKTSEGIYMVIRDGIEGFIFVAISDTAKNGVNSLVILVSLEARDKIYVARLRLPDISSTMLDVFMIYQNISSAPDFAT